MVIFVAAACSGPPAGDGGRDRTPTDGQPPDTDPPTDGLPDPETADTASTTPPTPTGDTAAEYDCSVLPAIPVTWTNLTQFQTSEDFDIDGDGYMCTNRSGALACKDMAGNQKVLTVGLGSTAGIRVAATGDWLYNDVGNGALVKVDPLTGAKVTVASGIAYPNGLEVGRDGYAFIGENGSDKVRQIHIDTGAQYVAAEGLAAPNGVILSPDEQTLYVGSFGGGVIYAVDRISETEWDAPRELHNPPNPDGGFDGINVDSCGNVYITEYTVGRVFRITDPAGPGNGEVADLPESWIPNMRWGHDIAGWDSSTLYVSAWGSIYALDMGVPGKRHILLP
jgi:hypothetical protein